MKNCRNCCFWIQQTLKVGICSRYAPRPILKIYANAELRNETLDVPGIFSPVTGSLFYCGDHIDKIEETQPPATKKKK